MNGKMKDPDKRTHQDPSASSASLTFSRGARSEPLVAREALTWGHVMCEVVGSGAYLEYRWRLYIYLEFREMGLMCHMKQDGSEAVPSLYHDYMKTVGTNHPA